MSIEVGRFGICKYAMTHLMPDVCGCHVLQILAVAMCRIRNNCCLPAPTHQPFSFNSLDLSAPEEACSRNVRASGTLKFGYKGIFKILPRNAHGTYKVACTKCSCMVLSLHNTLARTTCGWNSMQYTKKNAKPILGFKDKFDAASQ